MRNRRPAASRPTGAIALRGRCSSKRWLRSSAATNAKTASGTSGAWRRPARAGAYANLEVLKGAGVEPGAGVTIGFLDSGIDRDHPAFAGKTVTERFLPGAVDETGSDTASHGTAVASVAAAGKAASSDAAPGLARGADIAMFAISFPPAGDGYLPVSLAELDGYDDRMASYFDTVLGWRDGARKVDILNLSFGANGIIDNYTEQQLRENFDSAIAAMTQAGASEKTILVWGAGERPRPGRCRCRRAPNVSAKGSTRFRSRSFPALPHASRSFGAIPSPRWR